MEDYTKQGLLHEMFSRQAKATPDKVAMVEAGGRTMTFSQLDTASTALATQLCKQGVGPDKCVGIYMDKCMDFTLAYIAILKAGGAYLPLDISYPQKMLESVLEDSKPVTILTHKHLVQNIKGVPVIELDSDWQKKSQDGKSSTGEDLQQGQSATMDNLAYIVYSSGTTGKPKGIMCPHRGAVFSYHLRHVLYPYTEEDREACNVFFVWEMLRPLIKGVPMYIIPSTVIYDPPLLCDFLREHNITRMLFTPSLLETVLNTPGINLEEGFHTMKTIFFCGEVVTTALFQKCLKMLSWVQFINLYSVSECHDVAYEDLNIYFKENKDSLSSRKFCPVGKVLPGVQIVILNDKLNLQPVGASGEIYVGGPTLARGYLNRPEDQARRFISRPESVPGSSGDKLYRTGDWGYMLSDGSLEICGRCDSMVKIRGYSIEVQAVEAALMDLSLVQACVVLVKGEEGEDKFLVAYIVRKEETNKKTIRAELKKRLPFYMIPSYFVFLSSIPVVAQSGKLDKAALPPFHRESEKDVHIEGQPTTKTEKGVAVIWCKVLQTPDDDVMESFFDMGGHSLLATELINRVNEKFGVKIAVRDLFLYPTIASLSKLIESKLTEGDEPRLKVEVKESIDLMEEVNKHDQGIVNIDMQLRAFWRTFAFFNEGRFRKGRVLLTGATGFLGAFILRELVLQTKTFIFCLVRELPGKNAVERLYASLRQFGILPPEGSTDLPTEEQIAIEQAMKKRVMPIKGNVSLVNLGMEEEEYTSLCPDVDFVIHAAAAVNLVYPYTALHGTNVLGTANVIVFACTGKLKPIHYISTDAVFPNGLKDCQESDSCLDYHSRLDDGYSQSKWVAEQLVRRAGQRGVPITIHRLGNLSGDRKFAGWNPQDFTLVLLKACSQLGVAPDVDWDMEMTPVDFAAEVIVKFTQKISLCMGKTFHIINDKPLKARWVFEWMKAHGFPMQIVPFEDWRNRALESATSSQTSNGLLHQLLDSYIKDQSFFTSLSTYRSDCLKETLKSLSLSYPYTDGALLKTYFTHLSQRRVIVRQRSTIATGKPLEGRVAIVTGASSGIGRAIAVALCDAGAKVAMAARRVERLQELEKTITDNGGVAICVKTDVTKREQVQELVAHTELTLGPVDILVNNAGVMYYTMMKNLHVAEWDTQIDVNVKGVTNCIGAVLSGMLSRKKGHIVNMSSDAGRKGFAGLAVYSGTKFYVEGLSQALRQEVCGSGLRVTCIQPGDVRTELIGHTTDTEAKEAYDGSSSTKILEPEDIANAVLYAVTQPPYVGVNELLIEPREAPV